MPGEEGHKPRARPGGSSVPAPGLIGGLARPGHDPSALRTRTDRPATTSALENEPSVRDLDAFEAGEIIHPQK